MLLQSTSRETIVVLGAGVIGLTIAVRLQELGFNVVIVAKDFPAPFETINAQTQINYTSPWAGAHNGWGRDLPGEEASQAEWRDHSFALTTFARMTQLHDKYSDAGITFTKGIEYFDDPPEMIKGLSPEKASNLGIQDFRLLSDDQLPEGVQIGYSYRTWCVNPMVYCCFLLRKAVLSGGQIIQRQLQSPAEVFASPDLPQVKYVINASGTGFGDKNVFITRGQTCLVANNCDVSLSRHYADGTSSFCIPRHFSGGTVIGGTHEPNDWNPAPAVGLRQHLLERLAATYPEILGKSGEFVPLRDIVGRRPTRKEGMRLEREELGREKTIVHAYGAGGRGYELSWGVADCVASMIARSD